jgi:hypothetical protein
MDQRPTTTGGLAPSDRPDEQKRHGRHLRGTVVSAAIALVLGVALVLFKALLH